MRAYIKPIMMEQFREQFEGADEINREQLNEFVNNFLSDDMKREISRAVGGSPQGNGAILNHDSFLTDLLRTIRYELVNSMGYRGKDKKERGTVYFREG